MKATSNRALLLLAAIACVPLACKDGGCGGSSNNATPTASVSAPVSASPIASTSSSGRARGSAVRAAGVTGSIFRAVNSLELKPEQKSAIDKIGADLKEAEKTATETDGGTSRGEMKASHDDLVAGVKLGKVDTAKMDGHIAAMEKASKAGQDREADVLNKLHALLDPAQRAATVAAVKAADAQRADRMKARAAADGGAPWMTADGGVRSMTARSRLENLTKDLDLEAEQAKKVEAILPKDDPKTDMREEMKKRSESMLAAFEKDGFDAKKEEVEPKKAVQPMAEMVKYLSQLVPLLTPNQRDRLVVKVERGPGAEGRRPGRGFDRGHDGEEEDDNGE